MIAIKTRTLGILAVAAIFGGIALSAGLGLWKTTSSKEPAKIKSGAFSGMPSPSDIRGSYTWADVAKAFGIPVSSIVTAFGAAGPEEKVNSLEARFGGKLPSGMEIGTDSARLFTALYTGLPHEIEADTVLPRTAIAVLRAEGKADGARIDAAAARAIDGAPASAEAPKPAAAEAPKPVASAAASAAPVPASAEHAPVVGAVTGKTTFFDLQSWGFDMKKVEIALGGLGPSSQSIKDYCVSKELAFSDIKTKLEGIVPK